jgi:hypothetical protein
MTPVSINKFQQNLLTEAYKGVAYVYDVSADEIQDTWARLNFMVDLQDDIKHECRAKLFGKLRSKNLR